MFGIGKKSTEKKPKPAKTKVSLRSLKFSNKQEVDITVCYYHLEDGKQRYVFFFYDPTEKTPIYKWAYYLLNNNYKELRKEFNKILKEKNYKPNKLANLCMCNQTTRINTVKLPKTLKYTMNYKSIIYDDLKDKMGSDFKNKYFISNSVEGVDEKKADKIEKRVMTEATRRQAIVKRYKDKVAKEEYEYNYELNREKAPLVRRINWYYIITTSILVGIGLGLLLLFLLDFIFWFLFYIYAGLAAAFVISILLLELYKKKKNLTPQKREGKFKITYKQAIDIYYYVFSLIVFYGSEILAYFIYLDKISAIFKNIYGILVVLYIISILVIERIKRKNLSGLDKVIERKPREKKVIVYNVEQDEDEEELFEGAMNENKLFNMSRSKVKIKKSKKAKSVITYRQLLVPKDEYKAATKVLANLHLGVRNLRTLPSLLASFHKKFSKGVNEIIAYNEAGFTCFVGFVNDQIIDSMFINGSGRAKNDDGNSVGLHLSSFRNIFSSLLWACQKESVNMDRVVYISNTPKNIESFKHENLFGLPYEIVQTTDIVFGESVRKVKSMGVLKGGFTLVETVVALAVFAITASMIATLSLGINRFNRNMNDTAKANLYLNNITEVLNNDQSDSTIRLVTTRPFENNVLDYYFVDANFNVFNASHSQLKMMYRVDYKMEKSTFEYASVEHTHFTLYINKISRINEQRNIVSPTKIEVVR